MERYLLLTFSGFWGDIHLHMDRVFSALSACFSALRTVSISLSPQPTLEQIQRCKSQLNFKTEKDRRLWHLLELRGFLLQRPDKAGLEERRGWVEVEKTRGHSPRVPGWGLGSYLSELSAEPVLCGPTIHWSYRKLSTTILDSFQSLSLGRWYIGLYDEAEELLLDQG